MKKIPASTIFLLLLVPFLLLTGLIMSKSSTPTGMPYCYLDVVCDKSQILNEDKLQQLNDYHKILLERHDIDLRILISNNTTAAQTMGYFGAAKVGNKSNSGYGALFMIDPQASLVRFHASPALRSVYTDQFVSYLETQQMMPFFRAGQLSSGIVESDKLIVLRAQEAAEGKEFNFESYQDAANALRNESAQSRASKAYANDPLRAPNVQRPAEIVSEYLRTLSLKNTNYDLPIYSQASRKMKQAVPTTTEQMKVELNTRYMCEIFKEVILDDGLAALIYKVDQKKCSPYFLIFEDGAWRLDLVSMASTLRVNSKGEWYINMSKPNIYADALLDLQFDKDGFAHPLPKMRWGLLIDSDINARVTFIKKIYDNTAAKRMPLQEKDVILQWDGLQNPTHTDIEANMADSESGRKIPVLLWRKGQKMEVEIVAPPRLDLQ